MEAPLLLPVSEVGRLLGISTAFAYILVKDRTIPSVKIGDRRLVSMVALNAYIKGLEAEANAELELVEAGE